jgi:hypothetical protein
MDQHWMRDHPAWIRDNFTLCDRSERKGREAAYAQRLHWQHGTERRILNFIGAVFLTSPIWVTLLDWLGWL